MKVFAAAVLACAVSAESETCKAFKLAYAEYDCNSDGCKAKDQSNQVFVATEATATKAYETACDSAVANVAAIGALAAAAAALAF